MTKEFSAKVPEEEYQRFLKNTDSIYGATTWFIVGALKTFNDEMEKDPALREKMQGSIRKFLKDRKEQQA